MLWLILFKSYFKEKGKNLATIEDIGEITTEVESVKKDFSEKFENYKSKLNEELSLKIEPLKSMLQRENITYQINLAELTKARFDRIDSLYIDLITLQKYISNNLFFYQDDTDFNLKISEFKKLYEIADISRHKCSLYITDDLKQKIINVLNGCHSAYMEFRGLYNSDTRKLGEISIFNVSKQQLLQQLTSQNIHHLNKLDDHISKFPELLEELEKEFKQQIILKDN